MMSADLGPLHLELELARAEQAGDPYAFRFAPQDYLVRRADDGFETVRLAWDTALLDDLNGIRWCCSASAKCCADFWRRRAERISRARSSRRLRRSARCSSRCAR